MLLRNLSSELESLALRRKKIAFLSGPRQCGKTTLAKSLIASSDLYFNWDQLKFRQLWTKNPEKIAAIALEKKDPRLVFDELHKNRQWKRELKGFYDEFGETVEMLVTGSARLDTYRKGGDSLLGRFYHFHLHPFSLSEVIQAKYWTFREFEKHLSVLDITQNNSSAEATKQLFRFGGFPEPFLSGSEKILNVWHRNRLELLIRQDLRDLSQIQEINQVETLAALLPLKVGSPLSIQSLREDVEVAFTTIQRWLRFLETLFFHFEVKPYSKSIARGLKKEGKIYLFDWSVIEDEGARFENMVASHLLKLCHFWTDTGMGTITLHYLRNKEKKEVDFLILKDLKPWFTIEAKLHDLNLDKTFQIFQKVLGVPHFQIVYPPQIVRKLKVDTGRAMVVSFEQFFYGTP